MRSISTALAALALLAGACTDNDTNDTVLSAAHGVPALTTYVAVVQFASIDNDLVNMLDSKKATLTVFASDNDAWNALAIQLTGNPNAVGTDLLVPANVNLLRSIIQYSTVDTKIPAANIPFGLPITTVQGSVLKIDSGTPPVITDGQNRMTSLLTTGVTTGNGILYPVNQVLLPPNMTSSQTIESAASAGQFTIFAQAIAAAQLVGVLNGTGPITVFAPTDQAFVAFFNESGISLAALLSNPQTLVDILNYQLVAGTVFVAALPVNTPVVTLQGGTFTVDQNLVITDSRGRTAHIVKTDVITSNGAIQIIDRVLLPPAR